MKRIAIALAAVVAVGIAGLVQAGSTTGPGVYTRIVPAKGEVTINEAYFGKQLAVLELTGDGDTDLDIYVYDAAGNLVVCGIGLTDRERVSFTPCATGAYRIVIRNLGCVWNRCQVRTN